MGIGADDTIQCTAVFFQSRSFEDDGVLDSNALADGHVGADGDVGADLGGGVDGGRGVDEGGRDDVGGGGGEEGRVGEFVVGEVEGSGRHRGTVGRQVGLQGKYKEKDSRGGLDLSPEIMCLVDVHFPSGSQGHNHILLETKDLVRLDEGVFPVEAAKSSRVESRYTKTTHAARAVFSSIATLITSKRDLSKR